MTCNIKPITIFPVTITYGKSKPSNNEFLLECINEIKELMESGICINNNHVKNTYSCNTM